MRHLPLFIEVISQAQHSNIRVCQKVVAELFKQKIAPLPFANSLKEAKEVLAAMKARGTKPSVFIINTFEAENILPELDQMIGNTPTLFFLRQIFSETSVMMNAAFGNVPADSIGTILQKMLPRPNSVWTYGTKTADGVAQKAAKSLVEMFADGDFFHIERHSQLQAQLMQMLKNAGAPDISDTLAAKASQTGAPAMKSSATLKSTPPTPTGTLKTPPPATNTAARPSARMPAAAASTGITGLIEQLGLSSMLTMFEMEKKSGELVISRRDETAKLLLKSGRIIHAMVDGLLVPLSSQFGTEAVYYTLTWTHGVFQFTPRAVEQQDEINIPTTQFLMEAARRSDHSSARMS